MVIFLSAVFAVALLVVIVYALHRYQQKEKTESVDRGLPLPPLEVDGDPIIADENPEDILGLSGQPPSDGENPRSPPRSKESIITTTQPVAHVHAVTPRAGESTNWLSASRSLKDAGDLNGALELCGLAYPQAGAFKQACVLIRAMLREARSAGQSPELLLELLYRTAALSAYFHAKDDQLPPFSPSELRKINNDDWIDMPLPYQDLGVDYIPLLNNADIKQLREFWGVPANHLSVRHFHHKTWLQMTLTERKSSSNGVLNL